MGQGFQVGCSIVVSYRKSARVVSFVRKGLSWAEAEQFMQGKKRRSVWKDLKHSPHAKKLSGSSKSKCQVEAERFRLDDQFKALPGSARPSQSVKSFGNSLISLASGPPEGSQRVREWPSAFDEAVWRMEEQGWKMLESWQPEFVWKSLPESSYWTRIGRLSLCRMSANVRRTWFRPGASLSFGVMDIPAGWIACAEGLPEASWGRMADAQCSTCTFSRHEHRSAEEKGFQMARYLTAFGVFRRPPWKRAILQTNSPCTGPARTWLSLKTLALAFNTLFVSKVFLWKRGSWSKNIGFVQSTV